MLYQVSIRESSTDRAHRSREDGHVEAQAIQTDSGGVRGAVAVKRSGLCRRPVDSNSALSDNGGGCYSPPIVQSTPFDMLPAVNPEWAPVVNGSSPFFSPVLAHETVVGITVNDALRAARLEDGSPRRTVSDRRSRVSAGSTLRRRSARRLGRDGFWRSAVWSERHGVRGDEQHGRVHAEVSDRTRRGRLARRCGHGGARDEMTHAENCD